jgi:protein MpaA
MCAPPLPGACHDASVISFGSRRVPWSFALLALLALVAGVWIGARGNEDSEAAAPVVAAAGIPARDNTAGASVAGQVRVHLLGRSVQGRLIRAYELGDPLAPRRALVVGYVHGDERAGLAIVRQLRARAKTISGVDLWVVPTTNPDGGAANTRQNARGVDLNRNFPAGWTPLPRGTYYSGTGPLSEPESKIAHALIQRLKPDVSIWYHQHAQLVDASGGDPAAERRYANLVGLPFKRFTRPPGSITTWTNRTYKGTTAFVVELPAGSLSPASAARHARAVLALAARAQSGAAEARPRASAERDPGVQG